MYALFYVILNKGLEHLQILLSVVGRGSWNQSPLETERQFYFQKQEQARFDPGAIVCQPLSYTHIQHISLGDYI